MLRRVVASTPRLPPVALSLRYLHAKPVRPWNSHRLTTRDPETTTQPANNAEKSPFAFEKIAKTSAPKPATDKPKRRPLKPLRAAITLTPAAVEHLQQLLDPPEPKLIRVGVRNRGCSGLIYHLEYVEKPGKFDEEVVQNGVKVLIDSKALFSVIGSRMDWVDDKLSSRFVFSNPNSKGECGCGESFMV